MCTRCSRTGKFKFCGADASIGLGEVRVGSLDGLGSALEGQAGTYTKWNHLKCWRVPNKVKEVNIASSTSSIVFVYLLLLLIL